MKMQKATPELFRAALPELLAMIVEESPTLYIDILTDDRYWRVCWSAWLWNSHGKWYDEEMREVLILLGKRGDTFIWERQ